jgi:hypothetical protein
VTEAVADDVVLIASDGLWNVLGQRRAKGDTSQEEKGLTGELLTSLHPPPHMTHASSSSYDTCILLLI